MKLENYDTGYTPPAPSVTMRVLATNSALSQVIPALPDPGADQTLIPRSIIQKLNLDVSGKVTIVSATGAFAALQFSAIIVINGLPQVALNIAEFSFEEHAILGRDFLNQFKVTLDGPNRLFSIE